MTKIEKFLKIDGEIARISKEKKISSTDQTEINNIRKDILYDRISCAELGINYSNPSFLDMRKAYLAALKQYKN